MLADLKAGGWDPASISNRSKCELGERLRLATGLPLRSITGFLRISRSSYEYHRARLGRDRDAALRPLVAAEFEASGGRYGYRRVHAALRRRGVVASEKRVRRVMREEGLEAARPRRRRWSSYAGEEGRAPAPNLLLVDADRDLHDFSAARPGEVLVTDITEFRLPGGAGKVYLSPCVDLFRRRRSSAFSAGTSPSKALVAEMLEGAVAATGGGFTLHSDRGWHYRTPDWVRDCAGAGVTSVHVQERPLAGQRGLRGLLRRAQGRVLPRPRLVGRLRRGVRGGAVGIHRLVPRGAPQGVRRGRRGTCTTRSGGAGSGSG